MGLVDRVFMSPLLRNSLGWFYLVSGLVLTIAAIVLPAHQDLAELEQKRLAIADDYADLNHQIAIHQSFLDDLSQNHLKLRERMIEMQFNQSATGTPVVIDRSAAKTPLEWVAQRARQTRVLDVEEPRDSILTILSKGRNRLWLAGSGVFVIFIGLVMSPTKEIDPPTVH